MLYMRNLSFCKHQVGVCSCHVQASVLRTAEMSHPSSGRGESRVQVHLHNLFQHTDYSLGGPIIPRTPARMADVKTDIASRTDAESGPRSPAVTAWNGSGLIPLTGGRAHLQPGVLFALHEAHHLHALVHRRHRQNLGPQIGRVVVRGHVLHGDAAAVHQLLHEELSNAQVSYSSESSATCDSPIWSRRTPVA